MKLDICKYFSEPIFVCLLIFFKQLHLRPTEFLFRLARQLILTYFFQHVMKLKKKKDKQILNLLN